MTTLKEEINNEINRCFSLTGKHEELVDQILLAIQARLPKEKEVLEYPETNGGDYEKGFNQALQQITNLLK